MQTQCPHCDTRFRVTESQVNTADGFVRCSVCKEVFNTLEIAEQDDFQQPLLQHEYADDEVSITETGNEISDLEVEAIDFSNEDSSTENFSTDDAEIEDSEKENPEIEAVDFNATSATDESRKDAFDFFDETANESLSHVVPDQYKDSYNADSPNVISNLLWGAGILLLSATLFIEYAWFNRDQLNKTPELRPLMETLCQHIECRDISMRSPDEIELISRNVYSHPNEKKALMINITMKNNAQFAQPFPVMQIMFSDVRGGNVAARRFLPAEYLPAEIKQQLAQQLLEPDTNMTFTMEIQDPGKQALTYEFDFL